MDIEYNLDIENPDSFKFNLQNLDTITTSNLEEAVIKAVKITEKKINELNLNKVSICLSGIDGEIIIHYLKQETNLDIDAYTLAIDEPNSEIIRLSGEVCKKYNVKHNVLNYTLDDLLNSNLFLPNILHYPVRHYQYVLHPLLYKNIPKDRYIICGDGGISRMFPKYNEVYSQKKFSDYNFDIKNNYYVPIDGYTQAATLLSLKLCQRHGNTLWYTTCWDIWYHLLKHKDLITDGFLYFNDVELKKKEFEKISPVFCKKTTPYDTPKGMQTMFKIRTALREYYNKHKCWGKYPIGDCIVIPKVWLV